MTLTLRGEFGKAFSSKQLYHVQFVLLRTVMIRPDNKIWITAHYKTAESIFELFFFFKVQKQSTEENPTSFFFLMPPPRGF